MNCILKNASVYMCGGFERTDIAVADGKITFDTGAAGENSVIFDFSDCIIIPGLTDVHVHLREPGFSYKETIKTGTCAAARGGYTAVFSMPNLNPVPDSEENLKVQTDIIERDAVISVYPYAAITKGERGEELSDMEKLCEKVKAFSDDGRGVQKPEIMRRAMEIAAAHDKIIAAHCEVNELLRGGYIHDGEYAKKHNHRGICSASEYEQIKRDIELAKETGCKYHVCHISAKESVEAIRRAKAEGVDITCETGPHYLVLCDEDLQEDGRFKMNPPLRSREDRAALIKGLQDGTIDMIATDHAPHSAEEKARGLEKSLMGIVGIETAFPVMYTKLVKPGIISLERLIELMSINPCRRFGLSCGINEGDTANLTVIDLNREFTVDSDSFLSKGRATPFEGMRLFGEIRMTIAKGKTVYTEEGVRNA